MKVRVRETDASLPWEGVISRVHEELDGTREYCVHVRPSTDPPTPPRWCFEAWLEVIDKYVAAFS